jgi:rhodanese-related sulfurtransferase
MKLLKLKEIFSKTNLVDVLIISTTAIVVGLLYNSLLPNALPLIYKPKQVEITNDSLLFGNDTTNNMVQPAKKDSKTLVATTTNVFPVQNNNKSIPTDSTPKNEKKSNDTLKKEKPQELKFISYMQMKKIINAPNFIIIDARQSDSYNKGHIKGAINIFALDDVNVKVPKMFNLPPDKKIVVYCDGGACDLSDELAKELIQFGFKNIFVYSGGWAEWSEKENIK